MLSADQLEALKRQHGKIVVIPWDSHEIVFRRPTREQVREYRRMLGSPAEKTDAVESLAQMTLCAYDGNTDPNAARTLYTGQFLEEYPGFTGASVVTGALGWLTGVVEEEVAVDTGKGVRFLSARQKPTAAPSPNGYATAPEQAS